MSLRILAVCCVLIFTGTGLSAEPPKHATDDKSSQSATYTAEAIHTFQVELPSTVQPELTKLPPKLLREWRAKNYTANYVADGAANSMWPLSHRDTCLAVRSYVFRRETRDSDAVQVRGSTTCTPSSRFQLKPAQ